MKVGKFVALGSTNWTSNSRQNFEMSALVELDAAGEERYERMIKAINLHNHPSSTKDLEAAKSNQRITAFPARARSVSARRSPMPSGGEEPDYSVLRPVTLSVMPAAGAAERRSLSSHWSLVGSGSDPDVELDVDASSLPQRKTK